MNCKILKLKSGEEVISILTESKGKYILENPMLFRSTTLMDHMGRPYDMTTLKDWLYNSDQKTITIPRSHVASLIEPSEKCRSMYLQQLTNLSAVSTEVVTNEDRIEAEKEMEEMFNELFEKFGPGGGGLDEKGNPFPDEETEIGMEKMEEKQMIYMSMVFPPEMIMNLITSGILDPRDIQKMIKEVKKKNKFTGDEKERKDFGNKFSDWNPDPNSDDYA